MPLTTLPENTISQRKATLTTIGALAMGILMGIVYENGRFLRQIRTNPAKVVQSMSGSFDVIQRTGERFAEETKKESSRRALDYLELNAGMALGSYKPE